MTSGETTKFTLLNGKSTLKKIKYVYSKGKATKDVFINIGEIFATNIQMNSDLTISPQEYQGLMSELFN